MINEFKTLERLCILLSSGFVVPLPTDRVSNTPNVCSVLQRTRTTLESLDSRLADQRARSIADARHRQRELDAARQRVDLLTARNANLDAALDDFAAENVVRVSVFVSPRGAHGWDAYII